MRKNLQEGYTLTQLVGGIYADAKTKLYITPPFGIKHGQWRSEANRLVQSAGWYNAGGYWLGSGDLAKYDIVNISRKILISELFVVVTRESMRRRPLPDQANADIRALSSASLYIVSRNRIYINRMFIEDGWPLEIEGFGEIDILNPDEILSMLRHYRIVNC